MTTADSDRSAMRVNGNPALPNAARSGMAMKCGKPEMSMMESASTEPRTLSSGTSLQAPCLTTS